jgi:hypothetical protein
VTREGGRPLSGIAGICRSAPNEIRYSVLAWITFGWSRKISIGSRLPQLSLPQRFFGVERLAANLCEPGRKSLGHCEAKDSDCSRRFL